MTMVFFGIPFKKNTAHGIFQSYIVFSQQNNGIFASWTNKKFITVCTVWCTIVKVEKKTSVKSTNKRRNGCSWKITSLFLRRQTQLTPSMIFYTQLHHSELHFCLGSSLNETGEAIMAESPSEIHQVELKLGSYRPELPNFIPNSRLNTLKVAW